MNTRLRLALVVVGGLIALAGAKAYLASTGAIAVNPEPLIEQLKAVAVSTTVFVGGLVIASYGLKR